MEATIDTTNSSIDIKVADQSSTDTRKNYLIRKHTYIRFMFQEMEKHNSNQPLDLLKIVLVLLKTCVA